jgi:hypothetical protein
VTAVGRDDDLDVAPLDLGARQDFDARVCALMVMAPAVVPSASSFASVPIVVCTLLSVMAPAVPAALLVVSVAALTVIVSAVNPMAPPVPLAAPLFSIAPLLTLIVSPLNVTAPPMPPSMPVFSVTPLAMVMVSAVTSSFLPCRSKSPVKVIESVSSRAPRLPVSMMRSAANVPSDSIVTVSPINSVLPSPGDDLIVRLPVGSLNSMLSNVEMMLSLSTLILPSSVRETLISSANSDATTTRLAVSVLSVIGSKPV